MSEVAETEAPFFIVYQMGKVGSVSLANSLRAKFGEANVAHIHPHDVVLQTIDAQRTCGRAVIVMTGFREPLARCISAYFQTFANPINPWWYVGAPDEILAKGVDWLITDYKTKAPRHVSEKIALWLGEYQRTLGVGISDSERRANFWTASTEGVTFYVYKLEELAEFVHAASRDRWLGGLQLGTANDARQKWSGALYREFLQTFRLTRAEYVSVYGGLDYVRWLYGDHEIERLTERFISG